MATRGRETPGREAWKRVLVGPDTPNVLPPKEKLQAMRARVEAQRGHAFEPIRPSPIGHQPTLPVSTGFAARYCRRCGRTEAEHGQTIQKDSQGEAYGRPIEQDTEFEAGADAGIQLNKAEPGQESHPHGYAWTDGLPGEDRGTDIAAPGGPVGTRADFWRLTAPWGNVRPGQAGAQTPYVLGHRSLDIDRLVHDHGFATRYDGGPHGRADPTGAYLTHLVIPHGDSPDVGTREDRDAYAKVHELAHALTLPEVKRLYGEGRRVGRLGTLSLRDAQRALHWEYLATTRQRQLLADLGVHVDDADFNRELNTVAADAIHRLVTGTRRDPVKEAFVPHAYTIPLNVGQQVLAEEARRIGLRHSSDVLSRPQS